jgi:hypothetical protein
VPLRAGVPGADRPWLVARVEARANECVRHREVVMSAVSDVRQREERLHDGGVLDVEHHLEPGIERELEREQRAPRAPRHGADLATSGSRSQLNARHRRCNRPPAAQR